MMKNEPLKPVAVESQLSETAHQLFRLWLGVLATAIEEGYGLMSKAAEHKVMAEKEGRALLEKRASRITRASQQTDTPAFSLAPESVKLTGVATRKDIEALNEKVSQLSKQIDEMIG